jgi:hypothetical protein
MITPKFLQHNQEAEFLDVIGTKVFLLAIQSPLLTDFTPLPPPPPPSKSDLKMVCNVNIVYGNLKSENSLRLCPETSTILCRLCVHEFGSWKQKTNMRY